MHVTKFPFLSRCRLGASAAEHRYHDVLCNLHQLHDARQHECQYHRYGSRGRQYHIVSALYITFFFVDMHLNFFNVRCMFECENCYIKEIIL